MPSTHLHGRRIVRRCLPPMPSREARPMTTRIHRRARLEPPTLESGFSFTLRMIRAGQGWNMRVDPMLAERMPDVFGYSFEFMRRQIERGE